MGIEFETFGNAIVQFREDGKPVLTTDPWLTGSCYFGSWGMDKPVTPAQIRSVQESPFIWYSHGHPDHLHPESMAMLPRTARILLPDHYDREIFDSLTREGFEVTVLEYKKWFRLSDGIRVLCIDNENQDGILVVEAGDALVINLNDSPLCGEGDYLRKLVKNHRNSKTYLLALCSIDADMINIVDEKGKSLAGSPEQRKPGAIWDSASRAADLGVKNYCCSSSQHVYVREDSQWANPYRIGWADMKRHWSRPEVKLIEPYVTVDLGSGSITRNHPTQVGATPLPSGTGDDDWSATLDEEEWKRVEGFMRKFEIIKDRIDFIEFTVGGEKRRILLNETSGRSPKELRGINFIVPKQSLMQTVEYGYFDDLLIGNFMKTQLTNTKLYPDFSKQVGKLGGNAKVFTKADYRKFAHRYFSRSPRAWMAMRFAEAWRFDVMPRVRTISEKVGVKPALKVLYRRYLRKDPIEALTPEAPAG
jgi:hypothetical protein